MRLLILGNWHCQSNAHQYSLAFRRLGHDVTTAGPRFTPDDAARWRAGLLRMEWPPTPEEADAYVAEVLAGSLVPDVVTERGGHMRFDASLWPDAVVEFWAYGETPNLVTAWPGVPTLLVCGDTHTGHLASQVQRMEDGDYTAVAVQFRRADLAQFDHPSKHWLPPAADPRIWVHVPDAEKEYDVLFIGSTDPAVHKERVELIRFLKRELGEERVVVKHLFGERAALAMNRARVVLHRSLAGDLAMRVPEALCTGATLVADDVDGLRVLFSLPAVDVPSLWESSGSQEALGHICDLLNPARREEWDDWRKVCEARTHRAVLAAHTYEHRAQQLLDVLFPPLPKPEESARSLFPVVAPPTPRVSLVIPVLNHWEDLTVPLLEVLWLQFGDGGEYEVVVVNDGSTDGTPRDGVHTFARFVSQENAGFAAACNTGAREAKGEYLIFLNNDTEPREGWLAPLLAALDEGAGIAGPLLLFPDGSVQSAGLEQHTDGTWWNKTGDPGGPHQEQAVTGACLAIKRDTFWRLGAFDESFEGGGGCDDTDLCLRARAQGLRVVLIPQSLVVHREGSTRFHMESGYQLEQIKGQIARNQARLRERWGLPEPESNATRVVWDGPTDVSQHGSLALINSALTARLGLLLAGTRLGTVRISHRWTSVDWSWEPPGDDIDHWCVIAPWEMGQWPYAWNHAFSHEKFRCLFTPSEFSRRLFLGPPSGGWHPHGSYVSDLTPEKVFVVPNGVDLSVFTPDGDRLVAAPGTEDMFRVLFVGGLIRRKGIDLLYEAWRQAFTAAERVRLVLKATGTQTFYRDSTEWPNERRFPNIQIIDQDDYDSEWMARLYRSCDVLVLPSRGEAFGLPVLEAMACGTPVIVPEGGPFDEYVPTEAGLRVPLVSAGNLDTGESGALARALRWCYLHRDRLPVMGQVGHAAAQPYGWSAIAAKYAEVITEVCR